MVLISQSQGWWRTIPVFVAIAVTSLASYLILANAYRLSRVLGQSGIRILMRLMGLLLTAIAVQFVLNGLRHTGVLHS
jgi:multiple antibiotic resistance protein